MSESYNQNPIDMIKEKYSQFHNKEKDIADTIIELSMNVVYLSVKELAKKCGTSESSIIRFCKMIGYSGYSELKIEIAKGHLTNAATLYERETSDISPKNTAEDIISIQLNSSSMLISQLLNHIKKQTLNAIAQHIASASLVFIYGYTYSGYIAYPFYERLKSLGIPSFIAWDHLSMKQNSIMAGQNTVSIFISHSGMSFDSVNNAAEAKKNGSKIICITTSQESPLAQLSDWRIIVPDGPDSLFKNYYSVEVAFQVILNIIYTRTATYYHEIDNKDKSRQLEMEILKNGFVPY